MRMIIATKTKSREGINFGRPFGACGLRNLFQGFRCAPPLATNVRPLGAKTGLTQFFARRAPIVARSFYSWQWMPNSGEFGYENLKHRQWPGRKTTATARSADQLTPLPRSSRRRASWIVSG